MGRPDRPSLIASFEEHYGDVLRLLTWRTGDSARAADLAQDTYFRLAAAEASGQRVDNPRAYILRVASNLAIDWMRREGRIAAHETVTDEAAIAVPDPAPLAEAALLARERLRLLDRALRELPPKPRLALLMHRVGGLTQAEIAARLGVSESMVIKYVAQALRHCRDWRQRFDGQA